MNDEDRWNAEVNLPEMLTARGEDLSREGLVDTPKRMRKAWEEFLAGYLMDPKEILGRTFEAESEGLQVCRNIEFQSHCEHHGVIFYGVAHIGYVPNKVVAGLSKLSRLVDCFSRRLQIQERMTHQIVEAMEEYLEPKGILVVTNARHFCCMGRGIKRTKMDYVCSDTRGDIDASLFSILLGDNNGIGF